MLCTAVLWDAPLATPPLLLATPPLLSPPSGASEPPRRLTSTRARQTADASTTSASHEREDPTSSRIGLPGLARRAQRHARL
jgi:hypothetical protein